MKLNSKFRRIIKRIDLKGYFFLGLKLHLLYTLPIIPSHYLRRTIIYQTQYNYCFLPAEIDEVFPVSIQPISPAYADAARLEGRTVRLKLAYELLDVNPHKFVFSGKREIRGGWTIFSAMSDYFTWSVCRNTSRCLDCRKAPRKSG